MAKTTRGAARRQAPVELDDNMSVSDAQSTVLNVD